MWSSSGFTAAVVGSSPRGWVAGYSRGARGPGRANIANGPRRPFAPVRIWRENPCGAAWGRRRARGAYTAWRNEAYASAQEAQARTGSRVPRAHVLARGATHAQASPQQGPPAPVRLIVAMRPPAHASRR